jgi:hypothetical protein
MAAKSTKLNDVLESKLKWNDISKKIDDLDELYPKNIPGNLEKEIEILNELYAKYIKEVDPDYVDEKKFLGLREDHHPKMFNSKYITSNKCSALQKNYRFDKFLRKGSKDYTFLACKNESGKDDCNYTVNVTNLETKKDLDDWNETVRIANLAHTYGIGPEVYDSWICDRVFDKYFQINQKDGESKMISLLIPHGFLISKKLKETPWKWIKNFFENMTKFFNNMTEAKITLDSNYIKEFHAEYLKKCNRIAKEYKLNMQTLYYSTGYIFLIDILQDTMLDENGELFFIVFGPRRRKKIESWTEESIYDTKPNKNVEDYIDKNIKNFKSHAKQQWDYWITSARSSSPSYISSSLPYRSYSLPYPSITPP